MTDLPDSFYVRDGDTFVSTPLTRGPWDVRFQHGGPPAGLLVRALTAPGFQLVRWTIGLLRPIPIAPLTITVDDGRGRTAQRPVAQLFADGVLVAEARGIRIRRTDTGLRPPAPPPAWKAPDDLPVLPFDFFPDPVGYHRAISMRVVHGAWGASPIGVWARVDVPLVAGTPTSPREQLAILADAQSGMCSAVDPAQYGFVNPDLTAYVERDPEPHAGWFGFDIRFTVNATGSGLAQSEVRDGAGVVARTAQSLVIDPR